jgi:hypothetical protein
MRMERWRVAAVVGIAALVLVALIWVGVAQRLARIARQPAQTATAGVTMEAATAAGAVSAEPTQIIPGVPDGGNLPLSRNARPELRIGVQVQMTPGLQLALRSQPGADVGEIVGAMGAGDVATIVGGPRMTAGDSDTIVWWYVELADGTQAWAAANTSQQTLLVPVP